MVNSASFLSFFCWEDSSALTLDPEMQLLRQLISAKDDVAKVDDYLGTNPLVVCCDVGQLTFEARF